MAGETISYLWRHPRAPHGFRSGVSLHSHTNQSKESLAFLATVRNLFPMVRPLMEWIERKAAENYGMRIEYGASYWTPPMPPKLAFDLESAQIEKLDLAPMVSLTDHDTIQAPMLLRTVPSSCRTPVSVEWTVPYGGGLQAFHLGVHNLPSEKATAWMATFAEFTADPDETRLKEILSALNLEPDVLVVFNHPMWDLYLIGRDRHRFLVNQFLQHHGAWLHALELNGLRNWDENRATCALAERWNMILVAGGDRHGVEPNANIQLTNADCFSGFVREIRCEKKSHLLFMSQYAEPWKLRMMQSAIDAVRNFPEFPRGSRTWEDRFFHPDSKGVARPLRELWSDAPLLMSGAVRLFQLMGRRPVSSSLRMVWSDSQQMRLALGEHDG